MPAEIEFSLEPIENLNVFKQNPKLLYKLRQNTSEGNFYEAHQLYKTCHFRCINNELVEDATNLIFNAIVFFHTSKNQLYYCTDLSKVFIETLKKNANKTETIVDDELLQRIKLIHMALRQGREERNEFSCTILKWSASLFGSNKPSESF